MNSASSLGTKIIQITVLVWVNQHLIRRVPAEEFSLFPIVASVMVFAELFNMIFVGGLTRFIVEADAREDSDQITRIVSSLVPFLVGVAAILLLSLGLVAFHIDKVLKIDPRYVNDARIMLITQVAALAFGVIATPFACGLYVKQRFVTQSIVDLSFETLRVVVLVVLLFGVSTRVLWLVVASSVATLGRNWVRMMYTRRLVPAVRFSRSHFCVGTARQLIGYGAWTSIASVANLVTRTAPILLLNRFGTPLDVTVFYLGRLPDSQFRRLVSSAATPVNPAITSIFARRGKSALHSYYYRGGRYYLWATLLTVGPLIVFGKPIVNLYAGGDVLPAALVIAAFLGIYPVCWASAMFYHVSVAAGEVRSFFMTQLATQITTLVALVVTVGYFGYGAVGAAVAMALTNGLMHAFVLWNVALKFIGGKWLDFAKQTLWPGILPFGACLPACILYRQLADLNTWLAVGIGVALSMLVYLTVLILFCLDEMESGFVHELARRGRSVLSRSLGTVANAGNRK